MSVSELFIRRPVATCLLAIGLFLVGVVAFYLLPIAPLPRVDFPTISVSANLPGADPETMAATVAAPLERRLGEIAGVDELTSTSSQGSARITAQFDLDRDIQGAAHDVQAAINASGSDLPVDLPNPPTYRKLNPADAPVLILAVTSKTLSLDKLYNAADTILSQRLSQVSGVAQVSVTGSAKPAVRVTADPTRLSAAGLSLDDVRSVITRANVNAPKGVLTRGAQDMAISTNDELQNAVDYANLQLNIGGTNSVLRLADVATVRDGVENDRQAGWFNDTPAVIIIIQKQAAANVIETVDAVKALLPQLESWMPAGSEISILTDRTQTIRASVHDVEITLLISIALVVLVVLFSLGRFTPTFAASITVPLSLAGTFGVMWLLGYSLNNVSLLALVVCVGFVIDDAIVMIENIARHVELGESPLAGAIQGAKEITFTVISISLSLIAVFIPLLFMGGIVGRLFREFAVTLSVAIAISAIVTITVTPTIYGHLLARSKRQHKKTMLARWGEAFYGTLYKWYNRGLVIVMRHQVITLLVMLGSIVLTVYLYTVVPKGFFPNQDTGLLMGSTQSRSDISFTAMRAKQLEVTKLVLEDPAVASMGSSVGQGGFNASGNRGQMFISLKRQSERDDAEAVIARLRPKLAKIEGISVFLQSVQDLRVGGRSTGGQFQFALQSDNLDDLRIWTAKLVDRLKQEPGITDVTSDQDSSAGQVNVVVNRDAAARLKVNMSAIDNALQNGLAQRQVSTIYKTRNQYKVVLEASERYQADPNSLDDVYIKATDGTQVRLSAIAHFEDGVALLSITHQGQFPASTLSFNLPQGVALGEATETVQRLTNEIGMPPQIRASFAGNAKAFTDSMKTVPLLIIGALLAIYIVLGILYENTWHPITILSTLPSAGLGALLALLATGVELSIISIIGVILLLGIVKKNGIILVDFALEAERNRGMTPEQAMIEACDQRFRPILMTTLAAILGAVPLVVASGNGAELRQPLGITIIGGLILSQLLTLYTTPVVYLALERLRLRMHRVMGRKTLPGHSPATKEVLG